MRIELIGLAKRPTIATSRSQCHLQSYRQFFAACSGFQVIENDRYRQGVKPSAIMSDCDNSVIEVHNGATGGGTRCIA